MFVPLSVLGAVFAGQVARVIEYLRAQTDVSYPEFVHRLSSYPLIGSAVEWVQENTSISAEQVQGWLTDGLQAILKSAASMGGSVALNVFGTLIGFFLMIFMLFFLLRDGRHDRRAVGAARAGGAGAARAAAEVPGRSHARGGVRLGGDRACCRA